MKDIVHFWLVLQQLIYSYEHVFIIKTVLFLSIWSTVVAWLAWYRLWRTRALKNGPKMQSMIQSGEVHNALQAYPGFIAQIQKLLKHTVYGRHTQNAHWRYLWRLSQGPPLLARSGPGRSHIYSYQVCDSAIATSVAHSRVGWFSNCNKIWLRNMKWNVKLF